MPGIAPLQIQLAHSGQCHRVTVRPLSAERSIGWGSPLATWNAASRTRIAIEKALPVTRWHSVQWQRYVATGASLIS
jgi:hypothetical protein